MYPQAILDRPSNEAPGQFQRNPSGGSSFSLRLRGSLLTDPRGVCSSLAPCQHEKFLAAHVSINSLSQVLRRRLPVNFQPIKSTRQSGRLVIVEFNCAIRIGQ